MADNAEIGAQIMAVVDSLRDVVFAQARAGGRREPTEAYGADALTMLARTAATSMRGTTPDTPGDSASTAGSEATGGPVAVAGGARAVGVGRAKIIVRVDLLALLRGYPAAGEVAELVGFGPVAVSVIRDLIDSGDPILTAVATRGVDVVGVAHLGRRPTARQRTALEWLYPTCAVEGCSAVARLEMDHRQDWATTHITLFSLIDRLCPHHHRLKTRQNWGLVDGRGKRAFVAPTDARHPRHVLGDERAPAAVATGPPAGMR